MGEGLGVDAERKRGCAWSAPVRSALGWVVYAPEWSLSWSWWSLLVVLVVVVVVNGAFGGGWSLLVGWQREHPKVLQQQQQRIYTAHDSDTRQWLALNVQQVTVHLHGRTTLGRSFQDFSNSTQRHPGALGKPSSSTAVRNSTCDYWESKSVGLESFWNEDNKSGFFFVLNSVVRHTSALPQDFVRAWSPNNGFPE